MHTLAPWWRHVLFVLLALAALPAAAQDDPPGRVGRIAELQGQVWIYDLETGDWIAAVRNRPLTTGDRVATDGDGRAEIRIGSSTIRLGAGSEIDVLQIDDEKVRVQLHSGQLALRLRSHETAREFELVTAEGRFKPDRAGRYRLDRIDATTSAVVWNGQLLFEAPDNAATVTAGQRAEIVQSFGRTQVTWLQAQRDAFADEVAAAESAAERSVTTTRYVSPEMTGAEALEDHGRWVEDAEQGALWVPRTVVPGWAPYRFGHWVFVRPWGWTWVDNAPWGFAPFHYGRWVFWRNTWCWAPGRWVARPVYAPALVAWVGAPLAGVSISINIGPSVGWFPLGPREVFVPAYRVSPRYVRNVNVTHVTNITNITQIVNSPNTVVQQTNYIHRGAPHAVTVVPASVVSARQPVAPARVQLSDPHPSRPQERKLALSAQAPVSVAPPVAAPAAAAPRPAAPPPRTRPLTMPAAAPAASPQAVAPAPQGPPPPPAANGAAPPAAAAAPLAPAATAQRPAAAPPRPVPAPAVPPATLAAQPQPPAAPAAVRPVPAPRPVVQAERAVPPPPVTRPQVAPTPRPSGTAAPKPPNGPMAPVAPAAPPAAQGAAAAPAVPQGVPSAMPPAPATKPATPAPKPAARDEPREPGNGKQERR